MPGSVRRGQLHVRRTGTTANNACSYQSRRKMVPGCVWPRRAAELVDHQLVPPSSACSLPPLPSLVSIPSTMPWITLAALPGILPFISDRSCYYLTIVLSYQNRCLSVFLSASCLVNLISNSLVQSRTGFPFLLPRLIKLRFLECSPSPEASVNKVRNSATKKW